jgi:hypothetical protein
MESAQRNVHKRKFLKNIEESTHPYDLKSKSWLRDNLYNNIKSVFVGALRAIETRLGTGFEGYNGLRSEILRLGNDCIRKMHDYLDNVNVEFIPTTVEFKFVNKDKEKGKEDNNGA